MKLYKDGNPYDVKPLEEGSKVNLWIPAAKYCSERPLGYEHYFDEVDFCLFCGVAKNLGAHND